MPINHTWIVDDDSIFTFTARKLLISNKLTHNITSFTNGREAMDRLNQNLDNNHEPPNVILLDINMPVLDGWQFMDEFVLYPDKKNIIVYLVSSSIDPKDRKKASLLKDISGFLVKPFVLSELTQLMNKAESLVNVSQPKL